MGQAGTSDFTNLTPGFPAAAFQVGQVAGPGSGAAEAIPAASFITQIGAAGTFTPNKTFNWNIAGGAKTFYKGNPVAIDPTLKATLVAAGLGS